MMMMMMVIWCGDGTVAGRMGVVGGLIIVEKAELKEGK
jgi:hypothetical protein